MANPNLTRCCPTCRGNGVVELTGVYAETLVDVQNMLREQDEVIAGRDAWKFGCNATALNNRLAALERFGFLKSERFGRERRFYRAT